MINGTEQFLQASFGGPLAGPVPPVYHDTKKHGPGGTCNYFYIHLETLNFSLLVKFCRCMPGGTLKRSEVPKGSFAELLP